MKYYASLIGPLRGVYYPLPDELASEGKRRMAMNTCRLKDMWHSIYLAADVQRQALDFYDSVVLPDDFAKKLDYDSHAVEQVK